jgi:hypothetical protein
MSLINIAKSQTQGEISELDKIIKAIEERTKQMKAPMVAKRDMFRSRLGEINSEIKRQKINKDILKEIIDMREESDISGRAISGNVPVAPDAEGLPLLDSLANRR